MLPGVVRNHALDFRHQPLSIFVPMIALGPEGSTSSKGLNLNAFVAPPSEEKARSDPKLLYAAAWNLGTRLVLTELVAVLAWTCNVPFHYKEFLPATGSHEEGALVERIAFDEGLDLKADADVAAVE